MKLIKLFTISFVIFSLTACASNGKVVPRSAGYKTVTYGSIIASEEVTIGGTQTGIGSYVGSLAAINDSTSNSFVGLVLRGLAGAFVGSAAEETVTRKPGRLYTIETTNGNVVEILSANKELDGGDCVQVAHAGRRHTKIEAVDPANCASQPTEQTASILPTGYLSSN